MRYAWLCHPATVFAALLLFVNDHVLKQAWPGFVTGKLSDVAGLLVAPALLSLLLLRRADLTATLLTGTLFTLAKTTQTGAEAASQAWTLIAGPSRILADPTDLLALPALALAWWIRNHSHQVKRRWQIAIGVPLAVLAVAATGADAGPPRAKTVRVEAGAFVVYDSGMPGELRSTDGGRTWVPYEPGSELPTPHPSASGDPAPEPAGQRSGCVPRQPQRCYQLPGGALKVLKSDDAGVTWATEWEISPGRMEVLERAYGSRPASLSLAVQATPRGHVVVVANGRDGIAVRDEDGTWTRYGYTGDGSALLTSQATSLDGGDYVAEELAAGVLGGLFVIIAGLTIAARTRVLRWLVPGIGLVGAVFSLPTFYASGGVHLLLWPLAIGSLIGALIAAAIAAGVAKIGASATWRVLGVGVLVALGITLPFRGWSVGWPDRYGTALGLAVFFTLTITALGLTWIWSSTRHRDRA
ncbi:hypothetical protein [Nonomuraea typhae]|uniref:hypothetical protein n=1 Tax=Nonomuraea typhae TaxID=2603600 RepID=UPI0015E1E77E|nr:hypothetical protein [Nonomuraea typhae]